MQLTLIGLGSGLPATITAEGLAALMEAQIIIGAKRLLADLPVGCTDRRLCSYKAEEICACLLQARQQGCKAAALVYSGDTGFYSGAASLLQKISGQGFKITICPGISSVQLLSAALAQPWQSWRFVSAHGVACDPVAQCMQGAPVFFLTGGQTDPAAICAQLTQAGLGQLRAVVGQRLGTAGQSIRSGKVCELAQQGFDALSVLLVEGSPAVQRRSPGFRDDSFVRGDVPMTKQEVRAAALAKLGVRPADILWDVGAGTGSVSVEMALCALQGHVYAIECSPEGCALIRQNREKFGAYNLTLVEGFAPQALTELPAPDAVFIGGTKGSMAEIIEAVLKKNPSVRICISAIALETLQAALDVLSAHGIEAEVTQLSVSRTRPAGKLHLLMANNPVFLVTGNCL